MVGRRNFASWYSDWMRHFFASEKYSSWKVLTFFMTPQGAVLLLRDKNLWYILFQDLTYIFGRVTYSKMDATKSVDGHISFSFLFFLFSFGLHFQVMVLFSFGNLRCYLCFSFFFYVSGVVSSRTCLLLNIKKCS